MYYLKLSMARIELNFLQTGDDSFFLYDINMCGINTHFLVFLDSRVWELIKLENRRQELFS